MDVCSVAGGVGEGRKDTSHHTAPPLPIMVSRQRSGASCPNLTTVCEVASMDKPPKVSSASRLPPTLISRKHSTPAYTRRMQMVSSIRTAAPTTPLLGRVHFYINPALGQDCSSVRLRRHVSQLGRLNTIDTPTRPVRSPRHNPPCECSTRIDRVQCSTQISREKLQSASQFECPAPHPLTPGDEQELVDDAAGRGGAARRPAPAAAELPPWLAGPAPPQAHPFVRRPV